MEILRDVDPFLLFNTWMAEAIEKEQNDPEAMALATVGDDGMPAVRMVLMKGVDRDGFRFFTNMTSKKAEDIAATGVAALCFHWKSLGRQVRVEGRVIENTRQAAEDYFMTRHPESRLGAWASRQSAPLDSRDTLLARVAAFRDSFGTENIPCPPYWGGYIVVPRTIEFWQAGEARLHDRFVFTRENDAAPWDVQRLNP